MSSSALSVVAKLMVDIWEEVTLKDTLLVKSTNQMVRV